MSLFQFNDPLNLILIVSVIFIVGAIIIAIVLGILLRRRKRQPGKSGESRRDEPTVQSKRRPAESTETPTIPSTPADQTKNNDKDDTEPSLPVIKTVGEPNVLPHSGERPANIAWQIASLTDVGLKRDLNEDNMLMIEGESADLGPYGLYVIADGLGGHIAGEVASQLTVDTIEQRHDAYPPSPGSMSLEEWLKDTAMAANEAVLQHQESSETDKKMGSTLVMALVTGQHAHVVNVGDSRAYHLNSEEIKQITVDHSLVERLVQIGQITREEARTHKQRNVIYSTIGEKRKLEIGYFQVELHPSDRLLLCSDGLSEKVSDEHLLKISQHESDPATAIQLLIEAAKEAGGEDNITAIVIQMN